MNALHTIFESPVWGLMGWNLLFLVWQVSIVSLLVAAALKLAAGCSTKRYAIALAGLALCGVLPAGNTVWLAQSSELSRQTANRDSSNSARGRRDAENRRNEGPSRTRVESNLAGGEQDASPPATVGQDPTEGSPRQPRVVSENPGVASARIPASAPANDGQAATRHRAAGGGSAFARADLLVQTLTPWLGGIWLIGLGLAALRPVTGFVYGRMLVSRRGGESEKLVEICQRLAQRMGIGFPVRAMAIKELDVPMVVGIWRPLILIPVASLNGLSVAELEAVILHELAHIRRWDGIVNLVQVSIETLLFFHPAVWWMSSVVRQERENCCDDLAVQAGSARAQLARALFKIEQHRESNLAAGLAFTGGSTLQRIRRLLAAPPQELRQPRWAGMLPLVVAGLLAVGLTVVSSETDGRSPGREDDRSPAGQRERAEEDFSSLSMERVRLTSSADSALGLVDLEWSGVEQIKALQKKFPQAGQGRRGGEPAGWIADVELEFSGPDGQTVKIMLNSRSGLWSEGNGDWQLEGVELATPGSLLALLDSIRKEHARRVYDPMPGQREFATLDDLQQLEVEDRTTTRSLKYVGRTDWSPAAIQDAWLSFIAQEFPQLQHLEIPAGRKLTLAGLAELAKIDSLSTLRIRFVDLPRSDSRPAVELARLLAKMPNLKILDVSYSGAMTSEAALMELLNGGLERLIALRHAAGAEPSPELLLRALDSGIRSIDVSQNQLEQPATRPWQTRMDQPGANYYALAIKESLAELDRAEQMRQVRLQRALNQRCFADNEDRIASEFGGTWVAIVRGELLGGFDSMHSASEAADQVDAEALHRFVFQVGSSESSDSFGTSAWAEKPQWRQVGRAFRAANEITVGPSEWRVGENSLGAGDGRALLFLTTPATAADGRPWQLPSRGDAPAHSQQAFVASSMLEQEMTLPESDAIVLGLFRYSVPGTARSVAYDVECPKVQVRVAEPKLGIDQVVTAFLIPDEFTRRFPD